MQPAMAAPNTAAPATAALTMAAPTMAALTMAPPTMAALTTLHQLGCTEYGCTDYGCWANNDDRPVNNNRSTIVALKNSTSKNCSSNDKVFFLLPLPIHPVKWTPSTSNAQKCELWFKNSIKFPQQIIYILEWCWTCTAAAAVTAASMLLASCSCCFDWNGAAVLLGHRVKWSETTTRRCCCRDAITTQQEVPVGATSPRAIARSESKRHAIIGIRDDGAQSLQLWLPQWQWLVRQRVVLVRSRLLLALKVIAVKSKSKKWWEIKYIL